MVNNLTTNPIILDVVGGSSFVDMAGRASSVVFGGNQDTDTTILIYDAENMATRNRFMGAWNNGTSLAPDFWQLSGASATVAQESTIVKGGTYSAKVTRAGTNCILKHDVLQYAPPPRDQISWWVGRTIMAGMWVYATVNTRGYIASFDGTTTTTAGPHSGNSTWIWLQTAAATVHANAVELSIHGTVVTGDTSVYFSEPIIFEAKTWLSMLQTGPSVAISYPQGKPFKGLYLVTLTGGTVEITI